MLKIMIVDDMPIFLEYLRGCIDWETYGFTICAEAHDGKEALAKIEEVYPDIILTDITMPYVDGLELSEKVMEQYPEISIILITGNNEFEYARKAVRIGVCDYIVKPFEKEELLLSLLKLQDNINRALEAKNEIEELENQKKESILRKLILGKHESWEKHKEQFAENKIDFCSDYFLVCTMKLEYTNLDKLENISDWESIIVQMLKSKIEIEGCFHVLRDFENNIVLLLNFDSENEMKAYKTYELSDLNKVVKDRLDIDAIIGVSDYCYGLDNVKKGYMQAQQAIMRKEKDTIDKVVDYKKMREHGNEVYYSWNMIDNLNKALEQLNEEMIISTLKEEITRIEKEENRNLIISMYSGLISVLLTNVINSGRTIEAVFGTEFHPYEEMNAAMDNEERVNKLIEYFIKAMRFEKNNSNAKSHQIVENIKEYINNHYMESELCITDISKELLVNQTYLRSMFKSETNTTITEYITKYRMQLAKKLIQETDDKLVLIAEKVGYNDVSYFSKSFKKYYGISPKECR